MDTTLTDMQLKMFGGCGDEKASKSYAVVNYQMHNGMAINFTGNAEFDFVAGMIPHHAGASSMCDIYKEHTASTTQNQNICCGSKSICYNITYGATKWGKYQDDFSQPGETKQMLEVIELMGMKKIYNEKCDKLSAEKANLGMGHTPMSGMDHTQMSGGRQVMDMSSNHESMFMGCGQLHLPMSKDYTRLNMEMHTRMALKFTGNPDVDFLLGMIPHHEAAVEMCDIYYKYWPCASTGNRRQVCVNPMPTAEIQELLFEKKFDQISVLNYVHHVCTDHILVTQSGEIRWMKKELMRVDSSKMSELDKKNPCAAVVPTRAPTPKPTTPPKPEYTAVMDADLNSIVESATIVSGAALVAATVPPTAAPTTPPTTVAIIFDTITHTYSKHTD